MMRPWLALFLILSAPWAAARELSEDSVATFFDTAFAVQARQHHLAGAVVAVVHNDRVLLLRGYGYADIAQRVAADPQQSLFRIASISKPFVWTAVMQLYEQGRLDLDADVNDYLTTFRIPDTFAEPVRIRHLLTHTAGFEDYAIGMNARSLAEAHPLEDYLANHMPERVRPPGLQASYSNWGTSLAGHIVAQVSGQSWDAYIAEHILAPLDMPSTNTHSPVPEHLRERLATSYRFVAGRFKATDYEFMNDAPAGVMSTTARDMTRFMRAMLSDGVLDGQRILAADTVQRMRSPLFSAHPRLPPMLHGFYRADQNQQVIYGHGGDTNQFHSHLALLPEHNLGVFVSYNSEPADEARDQVVAAFVDHFFPVEYLPAPPPAVTLLDLAAYSGEYIPLRSNRSTIERLGTLVTGISIAARDDGLVINDSSRWRALSADEFVAELQDRYMIFQRGESGSVSHVVIGSPLGTYLKVDGLAAPGNQRQVIVLMLVIALAVLVGYGYRLVQPGRDVGLPVLPVMAAWLHSALLLCLYAILVATLSGDVTAFVLGVPGTLHQVLYLMIANAALGVYVIGAAGWQWRAQNGTLLMRLRYSLVALMALMNLAVAWYFNILSYPASGLPVVD